jgi:hypothetical protein
MSEVKLFHFPDAEPERWQVEEYEADGDAGIAVAIFTGPHAERRARELADRLRGAEQQKKPPGLLLTAIMMIQAAIATL